MRIQCLRRNRLPAAPYISELSRIDSEWTPVVRRSSILLDYIELYVCFDLTGRFISAASRGQCVLERTACAIGNAKINGR